MNHCILFLRGILTDKTGKLQLIFQNNIGATIQGQLLLAIDILETGQLPVRFMDLRGDIFSGDCDLPDQPTQFHLYPGHPHVPPKIDTEFRIIRNAFTHD